MITSLWDSIEMYCDEHEKPELMYLDNIRGNIYYVCSKSNNQEGAPCRNKLILKDFEKLMDRITNILYEAEMHNEVPNLQNLTFTINKIDYRIFEHKDKIKIAVKLKRLSTTRQ